MSPSRAFVRSRELQQKPWDWKSLPVSEGRFIRVVSPHHLILNPAVSFGTVAWRGTKDLTESTTAYWEVQVDGSPYGTSVQFGIGRRHTVSQTYDFVDLLGRDDNSYGLNYRGYAQRSGMNVRVCKPLEGINPRIGLFFDGPNRSLSFFINDEFLGTPFVDIDLSETLYPFHCSMHFDETMQSIFKESSALSTLTDSEESER